MVASSLLLAGYLLAQAVDPAAVDSIVTQGLAASKAPGIAVAVVRDGQVAYLKGHGVREAGGALPVTPDTLFCIGSMTKAFTATAMALLVDEGRMSWDDPVRKHLPWFHLSDPAADQLVVLRDLIAHRTGLDGNDLLWSGAPWTLEESVRRAGLLPLSFPFRARYRYNNLMYNAAGMAVAAAAGMPWQDFVARRIFEPLGMAGAKFTSGDALRAPDHASAHQPGDNNGAPQVIPWYSDDHQIRPAGSIKAGVRDLSRWMQFQLGDGSFEGRRLLSTRSLQETHTPQIVIPTDPLEPPSAYAMGWQVGEHAGRVIWQHGGAVVGFRAHVILAPTEKLGVVVLTNMDQAWVQQSTSFAVLDAMLNQPRKDWHGEAAAQARRAADAQQERRRAHDAARPAVARPSIDPSACAGAYRDPAYGEARVAAGPDGLVLSWSSFRLPLRHYRDAAYDVTGDSRLDGEQAEFVLGPGGQAASLKLLGRNFQRSPDRKPLAYESMARRIVDALKLRPGERVLMRYDRAHFGELVAPLQRLLRERKAVDLGPRALDDPLTLPLLDSADVFLWLPVGAKSRQYSPEERRLLARWLDQGGTRREIHFHWDDGSRLADGLNGEHDAALDAVYERALNTDYAALNAAQDRAIDLLRKGTARIHTPAGTDLFFRVGTRPFNKQNGDASPQRAQAAKMRVDREIELPAGVLRVAPIEETVTGVLVIPEARLGDRTARKIQLFFDNGRISRVRAEQGQDAVEAWLAASGDAARSFRELCIGFHPDLTPPATTGVMPYFGYGAGVLRLSLGDNEELGGKVRGGFTRWFFFPDASLHVDGTYLVRGGRLVF